MGFVLDLTHVLYCVALFVCLCIFSPRDEASLIASSDCAVGLSLQVFYQRYLLFLPRAGSTVSFLLAPQDQINPVL